jgi:hypothetical protein
MPSSVQFYMLPLLNYFNFKLCYIFARSIENPQVQNIVNQLDPVVSAVTRYPLLYGAISTEFLRQIYKNIIIIDRLYLLFNLLLFIIMSALQFGAEAGNLF